MSVTPSDAARRAPTGSAAGPGRIMKRRERPPASRPSPAQRSEDRVDVSVLVPVLNEERHIRQTVAAMQAQRFDGTFELLFADGRSQDRTREILLELARDDPRIRVLDNPRRGTASGLNVCLREARGRVRRADGRPHLLLRALPGGWRGAAAPRRHRVGERPRGSPPGRAGLARCRAGARLVAGPRRIAQVGRGRGGRRRARARQRACSAVCGERERVLAAGGWDERWPVNQDSEMAARFLLRGARLVCLPEMAGHYVPRDSLRRARAPVLSLRLLPRAHLPPPPAEHARLAPDRAGAVRRAARRRARPAPAASSLRAWRSRCMRVSVVLDRRARRRSAASGARRARCCSSVLPTMHLGWGFGTLVGALRFGAPTEALVQLALGPRGRARETAAEQAERVYAPSLHEQAG